MTYKFLEVLIPHHNNCYNDFLQCVCLVKLAHVYVWMQPVHVEEHKNQLHLLLRVEKFSPSQIDAISGVLLLVSVMTMAFPCYL